MSERELHICEDCGRFPDCPQLTNEVWYQIGGPDTLLCLRHAEMRLEREIEPEDLEDCPANAYTLTLAKRKGLL